MNKFLKEFNFEKQYWGIWEWFKFLITVILILAIIFFITLVALAIIKWSFGIIFS